MQAAESAATNSSSLIRRSAHLWIAGGVLLAIGGVLIGLHYAATALVEHAAYETCMEYLPRATDQKCRCLASRMSARMVAYDYIYRRIVHDEGIPSHEVDQMKKSCGFPPA